mmetsp:Transcript_31808/g.23004  ORF Transcript_31808/g.23004 Transcript_31808/m.23004 type:complete len:82 (-) Transcript_31808:50-295(-)
MCKFDGENAAQFVALQLLLDFGGSNLAAKPLDGAQVEAAVGDHSVLLNPMLATIGISFLAHKKATNLIQVLYVKGASNMIV